MEYIVIDNLLFVCIYDEIAPGIKPSNYYISIDGKIYNKERQKFMSSWITDRGYCVTCLTHVDGTQHQYSIHRLLMLVFCFVPGCQNLIVNHLDGNKSNNVISNFEWTDNAGNIQHAYDTGLEKSGENHRFATITEKQVRQICSILEQGINRNSFASIAQQVGCTPMIVLQIAYGYCWTQISREYNINYNNKLNHRFTEEQAELICWIFQKNKGLGFEYSFLEIAQTLNLDPHNNSFRQRTRRMFNRDPGYFKRITDKYNY